MSIVHVDLPAHGLVVLPLLPTDRQQSIPKPIFSWRAINLQRDTLKSIQNNFMKPADYHTDLSGSLGQNASWLRLAERLSLPIYTENWKYFGQPFGGDTVKIV